MIQKKLHDFSENDKFTHPDNYWGRKLLVFGMTFFTCFE